MILPDRLKKLCGLLVTGLFLFAATAIADDDVARPAHKELAKIEAYIESIQTLKARFAQTAEVYSDPIKGTFYLSRPGKLRFEYDPPLKDYIVADGRFIYFWDGKLETYSSSLIGLTLADFLLREDIKLNDGDIQVIDTARKDGLLGITLVDMDEPDNGRLTLIFKEQPKLQLLRWQVVDGGGYVTQVELSEIKTNIKLDEKELFRFIPPQIKNPGYN